MSRSSDNAMPVTPGLVTWARERAGYSIAEAAEHFKKIEEWERSKSKPSYQQLERMADRFKCPVAEFFFPEPPALPPIAETFRTLAEAELSRIPREVKQLLRKAKAMQLALAELTEGRNPAPRLITRDLRFAEDVAPNEMARRVRDYLSVDVKTQAAWESVEDALEKWRGLVNEAGVFVFKDAFKQRDFFGFCLEDREFPIVYVNNTSAKTRQIFTIIHELGHLLFHTSGIYLVDESYVDTLAEPDKRIEVTCNRFASDFLVPPDDFENRTTRLPANRDSATELSAFYKVSREVIYRRFLDLRRIDQREYRDAIEAWSGDLRRERSGGDYYNNQMAYLGRRYVGLALQRFYQNKIDRNELADYLNVKPANIPGIEDRYLRKESRE